VFWEERTDFKNEMGLFANKRICKSHPRKNGQSHIWHERYSSSLTKVLGFVACRVTSKTLVIGTAERNWGGVKQLKTDKRSHLSMASVEKQAVIFGAASMEEERVKRQAAEKFDASTIDDFWTNDDVEYDLGQTKFGVDLEELRHPVEQQKQTFHG
jgi:hypothetical protein